jgi:signal transduction histidine kinase
VGSVAPISILEFPRLIRLAVLLLSILFALPLPVAGSETQRTKRILMLFSENKFLPGNALVEEAARRVLEKSGHPLEFYAEYLDASRFPSQNHYRLFREYLRAKYGPRPPDLILAFLTTQFELAGQLPAELFPETPVVFGALTEDKIRRDRLGANATGLAVRMDVKGAIASILQLQPEIQRIVVVGGTAPLDKLFLRKTEEAARSLAGRIQFDFWVTRPMSEIRSQVASLLPRTVILFANMFRDAAGDTFVPEAAASLVAAAANVPVYVLIETNVGGGAVGGKVVHFEAAGRRVGELAQKVLEGTSPTSLPIEVYSEGAPIFDWRALRRWGISESRLPPGSIVRFRQPSLWELYGWYIIGALFVFVLQAAMIAALLLQRARRRQAEAELQRNREELAHVARISTVGELTTAVAHELNQPLGAILSNADAAEMFLKMEPPALDEVRDILADIRKDDQRASEVIRRMRDLLRKHELAPQAVEINAAVEEVLQLLSINASARKVTVKFEQTAGLPRVWCDPVHLQQVLLNLVVNGLEAMAEIPEDQRRLMVGAGHDGDGMVKVYVSDRGPGIPGDKLPKLFEPFFTTKKDGMGMGLSIARTIVEAHHGQIWAENNGDRGATFYFTVPVPKDALA